MQVGVYGNRFPVFFFPSSFGACFFVLVMGNPAMQTRSRVEAGGHLYWRCTSFEKAFQGAGL